MVYHCLSWKIVWCAMVLSCPWSCPVRFGLVLSCLVLTSLLCPLSSRDVNFDAFLWYWRAKDSKFLKAIVIERFDQAYGLALRALRLTGTSSWPGCSHPRRKFTCSHVPFCFRIEWSSLVCELCVLLKWCLGDLWKTWVPLDLSTFSFPSQVIVLREATISNSKVHSLFHVSCLRSVRIVKSIVRIWHMHVDVHSSDVVQWHTDRCGCTPLKLGPVKLARNVWVISHL